MVKRLKTTLKITLIVFIALPVLIVGGFSAAVLWIDFNQYKPLIEQEVLAKTGRTLHIDGNIEARPWPLQLHIGESRLGQAPGFDEETPFLSFEQLNLRLSMSRLLWSGEVHLLGVELFSPTLHLIEEKGQRNWQDLLASVSPSPTPWVRVVTQPAPSHQAWLKALAHIQLHSLSIHEGRVVWQQPQQTVELNRFELIAFDVQLGQRFKLQLEGEVSTTEDSKRYAFQMPTFITLAPDLSLIQLQDANLQLHTTDSAGLAAAYRMQLDMQALDWQPQSQHLNVSFAELNMLGSRLEFELSGRYGDMPDLQGRIHFVKANPRAWLQHWKLPHPAFVQAQALTRLSGHLDWALSAQGWQLSNLLLNLDATQVTGFAGYETQSPGAYQFDLKFGELNLDAYAASVPDAGEAQPGMEAGQVEPQTYLPLAIPVTTLRENNLQGQLAFERLTLWKTHYEQLHVGVNSDYGQLDLAPLDAQFYQGQLRSSLRVNVNEDTPVYQIKARLIDVAAQPWLADMLDYSHLNGTLSGWMDMRSQGTNAEGIKSHLNGQLHADLRDGYYIGFNLNDWLSGQPINESQTPIRRMTLRGEAIQGVFHLQQADLTSADYQAAAFGQVNLAQATLGVQLQLHYTNPPAHLSLAKNLRVPVFVEGALREPTWRVDFANTQLPPALRELFNSLNPS